MAANSYRRLDATQSSTSNRVSISFLTCSLILNVVSSSQINERESTTVNFGCSFGSSSSHNSVIYAMRSRHVGIARLYFVEASL